MTDKQEIQAGQGRPSAQVPEDNAAVPIPPAFVELQQQLEGDRRKLLKDTPNDPAGIKKFVANFLIGRLQEIIQTFGMGVTEAYTLAAGATTDLTRMRSYMLNKLVELGAEVDQNVLYGSLPESLIERVGTALANLGLELQEKLPNDEETQRRFNELHDALSEIFGRSPYGDDGDDGGDGGEDDEGEEGDSSEGDDAEEGTDS